MYDDGVLNIKDLMRSGLNEAELKQNLLNAFNIRPLDGWEAERLRHEQAGIHESMATIGG